MLDNRKIMIHTDLKAGDFACFQLRFHHVYVKLQTMFCISVKKKNSPYPQNFKFIDLEALLSRAFDDFKIFCDV